MLSKLSGRFYAWAKGRLILAVFAAFVLFMGGNLAAALSSLPGRDGTGIPRRSRLLHAG